LALYIWLYKEKNMMKTVRMLLAFAIVLMTIKPAMAVEKNIVTQLLGIGIGTPVSTVMGLVRGGVSKGVDYSGEFSEGIGGGHFGEVIGVPLGFVTGLVTGGVTGTVKGFVDGVHGGINDPLSLDSLGFGGSFTDYNPYDISLL
jgi:hypothetical protein